MNSWTPSETSWHFEAPGSQTYSLTRRWTRQPPAPGVSARDSDVTGKYQEMWDITTKYGELANKY